MTTAPTPVARTAAPTPASRPYATPAAANAPNYAVKGIGGKYQFQLRRLHSLTGIIFGGYVVVHLLVNATLVEGARYAGEPTVYQLQVDAIHSLPLLVAIEWFAIYLPLLYHTVYGIYIGVTGQPNAVRYGYGKNWAYTMQRLSSYVLVGFVLFHVLAFKGVFGGEIGAALTFVPIEYATESTVNHLNAAWWVGYVIYPIGILAATYHLSNGFWTAAITWGLTVSKKAQQRWGLVCLGIFALTTVSGFVALASALRQDVNPAVLAVQEGVGYVNPEAGAALSPSRAITESADAVKDAAE